MKLDIWLFFFFLLYIEIILESQKAAKIVQISPVYPSPIFPSGYVLIIVYQNQEFDINTV